MTKPSSLSKPPIFIIGNPRSGTTLLRLMMTCHPNICIPPECSWIVYKAYRWRHFICSKEYIEGFLDDLFTPATRKIETWKMNRDNLEQYLHYTAPQNYTELVDCVYRFWMRVNDPLAVRWGDKNNVYLRHIKEIDEICPDCQFIHLIRDVRDVVCSYKKLAECRQQNPNNRYTPGLPTTAEEAARHWLANITTVLNSMLHIDVSRRVTIYYEDLIVDPESSLVRVCDKIDEIFDPQMLDFDLYNRQHQLEPSVTLPWKQKTLSPLDPTNTGKWVNELSRGELRAVKQVAGNMMTMLGYMV